MKILLVTQYFYPENFKSNDIALELTKRGHEVTVLTGLPNYPQGEIYDSYGFFKKTNEIHLGVKVVRAWLIPRGKGSGIRLFLNYFSWAFFASIKAFFLALNAKYDAVIVHEPSPITQGFPAIVVKKMQKIPLYFWVLDLWPESLSSAGGINNKQVLGVFTKMVQFIYTNSDKLLISSRGFKKSILEKGNYESKLVYFPNWAEDTITNGVSDCEIPVLPNGFKVVFAGNIGMAQDLESVMNTALLLKNNSEIQFIIIGDGRNKGMVEEFVKLHNLIKTVHLLGRFPIESMKSFFDQSDALLVTLKDELIFNLTVPAKLQAYMSARKPIIGMLNGEGAQIINDANCGYAVNAGDFENLAKKISDLYNLTYNQRELMSNSGYNYYQENFTLNKCMDNLELILKSNQK